MMEGETEMIGSWGMIGWKGGTRGCKILIAFTYNFGKCKLITAFC